MIGKENFVKDILRRFDSILFYDGGGANNFCGKCKLMGETHFTHGPKIMELTKVSIIHTLHILL